MTVNQIYQEYLIPENLQKHMLRVAALGQMITKNWIGPGIDKKAVIQACALHDIAKPINFDLTKQSQFGMSPEDVDRLEKHQTRLKSQYGEDEHHCTVKICEEVGLNPAAVKLVDNLEWKYVPRLLRENDHISLIPIYCDMRIGPKGMLSIEERHHELGQRESVKDLENRIQNGITVETLIQKYTSVGLNTITDSQLDQHFAQLLNLEI